MGGKVTCTLGEVKNRADFIIYWGGNPAECHPRHFTKYTLTQKGKFVPEGRKGRTMVLVDIRETMSAKAADIFLQIRPGKDFEVVTTLRALVKNQPVDRERVAESGLTVEQLQDIVDRMNALIVKSMENAKVRQFMASEGLDPIGSSPEELAAQVRSEIAKYAGVIRLANIKLQ